MKPQHTASSCPRAPVTRMLGTADAVMFDISWSGMGALWYTLTNHLHTDLGHNSWVVQTPSRGSQVYLGPTYNEAAADCQQLPKSSRYAHTGHCGRRYVCYFLELNAGILCAIR